MSTFDIIILIILGIGAFSGYRKGFIMELISIIALILGVFLGLKLLYFGVEILRDKFHISGQFLPYVSFLIIFVLVVILTNLVGKVVKETVHMTFLGTFDRLGGILLGTLKWAFGISLFLWISNYVFPDFFDPDRESILMSKVEPIAPFVISYFTSMLPILERIFTDSQESYTWIMDALL